MTDKAKTPAERQRALRKRRKASELVQVRAWVHPEDRDRIAAYIKRLNKKRGIDAV